MGTPDGPGTTHPSPGAPGVSELARGQRFAMVLGARGPEDRHVLIWLLIERAGMARPLVRFGSEWIDDLEEVTAAAQG